MAGPFACNSILSAAALAQEKSHRKHHGFRHDKAICGISNDMRELEAGDTPALRFAYGARLGL